MRISNSQPCQGQRIMSPNLVYSISPGSGDGKNGPAPLSLPRQPQRLQRRGEVVEAVQDDRQPERLAAVA